VRLRFGWSSNLDGGSPSPLREGPHDTASWRFACAFRRRRTKLEVCLQARREDSAAAARQRELKGSYS